MTPITPQNDRFDKSDLYVGGWIDRILPVRARPFAYLMRLDRPIGTWLLLLPAWWSLALSFPQNPDIGHVFYMALLFGVGAIVMRGAGCVINDLWDRDLDAHVARTRARPLVTGAVTPRGAMMLVSVLFCMGLIIILQMNITAIIVAFCSVPFIVVYPLMKRITGWPQLFLGVTFNLGALIAWAAMTGTIGLSAILLYIAGIFWTLGYDTIYAHMDREDDVRIGVKSTALVLGDKTVPAIFVFYGMSSVFLFLALYHGAASLMVLPVIATITGLFIYQIRRIDIGNPATCLTLFKFNRNQGLAILVGIILCAYFY
jgi:4-hydroxybenzoate polyprenyltransferase